MPERRYRVLAIGSHRVQYMAPVFRRMAQHPSLDLSVAYCTLRGAKPTHDPDFDTTVQWDVPRLVIVAILAGYQAAQYILANDVNSLALAGVVLVAGAIVVAILNDWRRGLYLLVGWILFEDLVRKYLGNNNNMGIYFAKDALAIVLYLSFFRARRAKRIQLLQIPFGAPLTIFFGFACSRCPIKEVQVAQAASGGA